MSWFVVLPTHTNIAQKCNQPFTAHQTSDLQAQPDPETLSLLFCLLRIIYLGHVGLL
jgi:hypothetical protein